ncbi:DUF4340 domain-containing protein [Cytophagaceae bacterium ABcell3]|nr:DUF4340 domain-containing protein [Cytophagaceae bacterium ABcell3]
MILTTRIKILLSLVVVLSIAAWFTVKEKRTGSTFNEDLAVSIADTSSVYEIGYQSDEINGVLRRDRNNVWIINEKYPTRIQLSDLLLFGIAKLEIRRPVSEENKQKVYEKLKSEGIRVNVKEKDGEHVFHVLSNDNDPNSSYFLKEGSDTPYITYVPGFTGNLTNLLTLSENDWRSRTVFASDNRSLQKIKVHYPESEEDDFEIKYQEGSFGIAGINPIDTMKLVNYLQSFVMVNVSGFVDNPDSLREELANLQPKAILEVEDMLKERSNELLIYKPKDEKYWFGLVKAINEPVILRNELVERLLPVKEDFVYKQ